MLLEILGIIMLAASWYIDYTDTVLFDPIYTFLLQESLSALGVAIITRKILKRRRRSR